MITKKPKIVFLGTGDFAAPVLGALKKSGLAPALVIETKDEIPLEKIRSLKPDLFVIASFGKILSSEILSIPKFGTLNVHPSLLPKYRGPTPIQTAILNGDEKTGVTIMLTDEKMDHGPILAQQELALPAPPKAGPASQAQRGERGSSRQAGRQNSKLTYKELGKELAELGGELLIKTIPDWLSGKIKPKEQNHSKATYTKKIIKEDGLINWNEPALLIERKIRAFNPWPGAYSFWQKNNKKQRLIFLKAAIVMSLNDITLGKVFEVDNEFAVQTGKDALKIEILKPEGKKEMPSGAFLKGNSEILGQTLG